MAQSDAQAKWLPLMEYSIKNNISLSTLRRHIKADKIIYKMEEGRYYILDESNSSGSFIEAEQHSSPMTLDLELKLKKAEEEITELKMLIEIYEEQLIKKDPYLSP